MHPPQGPPGGQPPAHLSYPQQHPPQHQQPSYPEPPYPQASYPQQPYPQQLQQVQESSHPSVPHAGLTSAAAKKRARRAEKKASGGGGWDLIADKAIDFALIFVGLYAATALARCQDASKDKEEYVSLLRDFKRELDANRDQEGSIEKDLGAINETEPGKNLGPMQSTFTHFFEELKEDEKIVQCMHDEFLARLDAEPDAEHGSDKDDAPEGCHALYAQFDKAHGKKHEDSFSFQPAVLTPFYRREVWQLYLADGVKSFRNKDLAVRIAEVYANADLVEEQIEDIELTYNDAFMKQVGRTAATDMELAEVVHDEETQHGLSETDRTLLVHVDEAIKEEHYAALEVERVLELKVERMKKTVLLMRSEIEAVQQAIDEELAAQGWKAEDAEES